MITIIDYGMGNLGSILNMFKKIGYEAEITSDLEKIKNSEKIVLPGVGSFDNGMANLNKLNLINILNTLVLEKHIPILGICLGMQLITNSSQEGKLKGLGWVDANTLKFKFSKNNIKIPHMGWNNINIKKINPLLKNLNDSETRFYFVHSYYVKCNQKNDILTTTEYGFDFASSIQKDNIYGVQFHPEKSHKFGMKLFENFAKI